MKTSSLLAWPLSALHVPLLCVFYAPIAKEAASSLPENLRTFAYFDYLGKSYAVR